MDRASLLGHDLQGMIRLRAGFMSGVSPPQKGRDGVVSIPSASLLDSTCSVCSLLVGDNRSSSLACLRLAEGSSGLGRGGHGTVTRKKSERSI